jgi:hypothetical protein
MSFQEMPLAAEAKQLAPAPAVGANIPEVDPTVIRADGVRAELTGGIDLTATTSGKPHAGWWRARRLRGRLDRLFAQLALGLARVTGKRFGFTFVSRWLRHSWRGLAAWPKPTEQETQEDEENTGIQIKHQVGLHHQPLHSGGKWTDHTRFGAHLN